MLIDGKPERYFCRDNKGRDLFYVELTYCEDINFISIDTSLRYPIYDFPDVVTLIGKLTGENIPAHERSILMQQLFTCIQALPGIEAAFFSDELLNLSGKYLDYYDSVTTALLMDKDFEDYTVFTSRINPFYFDYVRPILQKELKENIAVFLSKNDFEILVKNGYELAQEYVWFYSFYAQYFKSFISSETGYDCFFMVIDSEVKLFFVVQLK